MKVAESIEGRNRFCGPAAIAFLTGVSTDEAARTIREQTEARGRVLRVWEVVAGGDGEKSRESGR